MSSEKITSGLSEDTKETVAAPQEETASGAPQGSQELTEFIQSLLQQMQTRFQDMSQAIVSRIDEMGSRIDELEKSIGELMTQTGIQEDQVRGTAPKTPGN